MSTIDDIRELHELLKSGVLTEEEFAFQKAKLLKPARAEEPTAKGNRSANQPHGKIKTKGEKSPINILSMISAIVVAVIINPFVEWPFLLMDYNYSIHLPFLLTRDSSGFIRNFPFMEQNEQNVESYSQAIQNLPGDAFIESFTAVIFVLSITYIVLSLLQLKKGIGFLAKARRFNRTNLLVSIIYAIITFPFFTDHSLGNAVGTMLKDNVSPFTLPFKYMINFLKSNEIFRLPAAIIDVLLFGTFILSVINIILILRKKETRHENNI